MLWHRDMQQQTAGEQLSGRFEALLLQQAPRLLTASSLDVLTLRAHATLEAVLRELLICRLAPTSGQIPNLNFARLAELALANMSRRLTELVLSINHIRNYIAHHLQADELSSHVANFLKRFPEYNTPWVEDEASQRVGWSLILIITIVAFGILPRVLTDWRSGDEVLRAGANEDEPTFLAGMSKPTLNFLNLQPWLARLSAANATGEAVPSIETLQAPATEANRKRPATRRRRSPKPGA